MKKMVKKKKVVKKGTVKAKPKAAKVLKPVGVVTHYFNAIRVAIVKCKQPFNTGAAVRFNGATTEFTDVVASMQFDHKPVARAKKGQEVGIQVKKRVREGDSMYIIG